MTHQTDSPSSISVPRHTRLLRRNGTYYLRAKVPKKIRHLIGKTEIRKSLGTKDPKEAVRKVKIESMLVDQRLAGEEAKLNGSVPPVSKADRLHCSVDLEKVQEVKPKSGRAWGVVCLAWRSVSNHRKFIGGWSCFGVSSADSVGKLS